MPTKEIAPGVLAVTELPDGATFNLVPDNTYKMWNTDKMDVIDIPGEWSILGWSDELTEEQCKGIVGNKVFLSATESFASLLRSHGITDRALIIKKEK